MPTSGDQSDQAIIPGWRLSLWLSLAAIVGGLLSVVQLAVDLQIAGRWMLYRDTVVPTASPWLLLAICAPFIVWSTRRLSLSPPLRGRSLAIHAALAASLTVLQSIFLAVVIVGVPPAGRLNLTAIAVLTGVRFTANALGYAAMVAVVAASDASRRARSRAETVSGLALQLTRARLDALRAQLNPHFLFNAMNTIGMLIRQNEQRTALGAVAGLSDLLRRILSDTADDVPLRVELELVRQYLAIEQMRFGDRLSVAYDISCEANEVFVPQLLLQPLVENAVRHGIEPRAAAGNIRISARVDAGTLTLEIVDDGRGISRPQIAPDRGVGLRNTTARLTQLFGEDYHFDVRNAHSGTGAIATVRIPARSRAAVAIQSETP